MQATASSFRLPALRCPRKDVRLVGKQFPLFPTVAEIVWVNNVELDYCFMTQLQQVFAGIYSLLDHIYYPLVFVVSLFVH